MAKKPLTEDMLFLHLHLPWYLNQSFPKLHRAVWGRICWTALGWVFINGFFIIFCYLGSNGLSLQMPFFFNLFCLLHLPFSESALSVSLGKDAQLLKTANRAEHKQMETVGDMMPIVFLGSRTGTLITCNATTYDNCNSFCQDLWSSYTLLL